QSVARSYRCPVYPLWAAGEEWIDSVPLGMGHSQYIDCRGARYASGLSQLVETLNGVIDGSPKHFPLRDSYRLPHGYLSIELDEGNIVAVRPKSYQSLQSLLNELYLAYLSDRYEPFTYGKDWILASKAHKYSKVGLV